MANVALTGPPAPESLIPSQRARRDRIVTAALRLLENGEYERIQMRDIAEQSDVALGTVYRYFVSKEHLFAAVLIEWSDSLHDHVQRRPLAGETPSAQLNDLMGRVLTAFERYPQFLRLLVVLETTRDPYARELHREFSEHVGSTFLEPLASLDRRLAADMLDVVKAVQSSLLRAWSQGSLSMRVARKRMSRCIELVFGCVEQPRPKRSRR